MEVSWYLRFNRTGGLEVLADSSTLKQIEHALHIEPKWTMEFEEISTEDISAEKQTYVRAVFVRAPKEGA